MPITKRYRVGIHSSLSYPLYFGRGKPGLTASQVQKGHGTLGASVSEGSECSLRGGPFDRAKRCSNLHTFVQQTSSVPQCAAPCARKAIDFWILGKLQARSSRDCIELRLVGFNATHAKRKCTVCRRAQAKRTLLQTRRTYKPDRMSHWHYFFLWTSGVG